ncbi:Malic enzyme NAD-binding [Penicillium coprophilum]|uniref:Malic enzyme NAD-binding n=1 Tax=Penicillium coprophilum TaxID=36646 RepID=UPI00239812BA|nr:Malic enzyme NAD-binding [Penicillium coprophilum]KAJ5178556.1 Malic enzyme NAD-binding [Penicillium coprophilum]
MATSKFHDLPRVAGPLTCPYKGTSLLKSSQFNKGSAFPEHERTKFKLHSLLPPNIQTLDEQVQRAYQQYQSRADDLAKNTFLASMKAQNEVLYYKLVQTHLKEMFSVIYTPTEGDAIENYSRLFRKPEGCFLNINDQDHFDEYLAGFGTKEDVDYIVVSDGEEVHTSLLEVELALETKVWALFSYRLRNWLLPRSVLESILRDSSRLYWIAGQMPPTASGQGEKYDEFVDKFVKAARKQFPKAYIHFEDFGLNNARRILDRYQSQIPCFNDDIQGTGCVTLAAMLAALQVSQVKLEDVRVVIFGSGTAGIGIADQISDTIATETRKSKDEASKQIWYVTMSDMEDEIPTHSVHSSRCIDKPGLLVKSLGDKLTEGQKSFARNDDQWSDNDRDLLSVVKKVHPHVLIGTSTKPGAFTEDIIREMADHVKRPIIFPLSNPTRLHEAKPADLYEWTDGRALVATGSPFPPVTHNGTDYEIAECNNSTCFPGIGLGAVLSQCRLMSKKMLVAAVEALKARSPALKDSAKPLLPDVEDVREISVDIAAAVISCAVEEGLAQAKGIPTDESELREWIRIQMWEAEYRPLVYEN